MSSRVQFGADGRLDEWLLNPDWIKAGAPATSGRTITEQSGLSSGIWTCTSGSFTWEYEVDELVYIIEGAARIKPSGDMAWIHVRPGCVVFFPAGSTAQWVIDDHVRKFYVLRRSFWRRLLAKLFKPRPL